VEDNRPGLRIAWNSPKRTPDAPRLPARVLFAAALLGLLERYWRPIAWWLGKGHRLLRLRSACCRWASSRRSRARSRGGNIRPGPRREPRRPSPGLSGDGRDHAPVHRPRLVPRHRRPWWPWSLVADRRKRQARGVMLMAWPVRPSWSISSSRKPSSARPSLFPEVATLHRNSAGVLP